MMRKRTFVGLTGMVLLSVLFLPGCPQPTDDTPPPPATLKLGKAGLVGKAEEGVNYLWWDSLDSIGANAWSMYRKDTVTQEISTLTVTTNNNWNVASDVVDWNNQLIDGRVYEYTLYTSSTSGGATTREKKDSVTLQARVPARDSFTIPLTDADIEVKKYSGASNGADMLLVSFPSQPNMRYQVAYTYGKDQTITKDFGNFAAVWSDTSASPAASDLANNWFAPRRAANFPLIGGANSVAVKATFVGNDNTVNGRYYDTAKVVPIALDSYTAAPALAAPTNFSATANINIIRYTWTHEDLDVTDFELYRAEVNQSVPSPEDVSTNANITVTGDWEQVALADMYGVTNTSTPAGKDWKAHTILTNADLAKYYVYVLFAKQGGYQSAPVWGNSSKPSIPSVTLTATPVNATIQLKWDTADATTYKLEYAEVRHSTNPLTAEADSNNYELYGSYNLVNNESTVAATQYPQGKAVVNHAPVVGKNYVYRLTPMAHGVAGTPAIAVVSSELFTTVVDLTPSQSTENGDAADTIKVGLTYTNTYFGNERSYSIRLYRREDSNPQTTFTQVTTQNLSSTNVNATNQITWTYLDTGLDVTKQYHYKVTADGHGAASNSGVITTALRPAGYDKITNTTSISWISADTTFGSDTIPANSVRINANNLVNLPVKVEILNSTTNNVVTTLANPAIEKLTSGSGTSTTYAYFIRLATTYTSLTGGSSYYIKITGPNNSPVTGANFSKP